MPTVEDYFDDDSDIPLPSSSAASSSKPKPKSRGLQGSGLQGALLEEIGDEDEVEDELDYSRLADQGRGVFGEDSKAPPTQASAPSNGKGKVAVRDTDGELRPAGPGGPAINPNTPMGGFMGDMMKLQQVEDERLERLRKQFGNTSVAADPSVYKEWNSVYPIYFDAKVSVASGRRVPRKSAIWWPQAGQISRACRTLGLPSVLEPGKTHPADWENPGRVKVQFARDGKFINPIVKNRTQLYRHLAAQLQSLNPSLVYSPSQAKSKTSEALPKPKPQSKGKDSTTGRKPKPKPPTRTPLPPMSLPQMDDRLPLHSPSVATGVAVASFKRDLEAEKESKKVGGGGEDGAGGKDKQPKMKRMVVRGKR